MPDAPVTALGALEPAAALVDLLDEQGARVDGVECLPSWNGTPVEYGIMVEWLLARRTGAPPPA